MCGWSARRRSLEPPQGCGRHGHISGERLFHPGGLAHYPPRLPKQRGKTAGRAAIHSFKSNDTRSDRIRLDQIILYRIGSLEQVDCRAKDKTWLGWAFDPLDAKRGTTWARAALGCVIVGGSVRICAAPSSRLGPSCARPGSGRGGRRRQRLKPLSAAATAGGGRRRRSAAVSGKLFRGLPLIADGGLAQLQGC